MRTKVRTVRRKPKSTAVYSVKEVKTERCKCCKSSADISISSSRVNRRGGSDHHHKKIGRIQLCCHNNCMSENIIASVKASGDTKPSGNSSGDGGFVEDNPDEEGSESPNRPFFGRLGDINPVASALVQIPRVSAIFHHIQIYPELMSNIIKAK